MSEEVDSFSGMFSKGLPAARGAARKARAEKERRAQLTEAQRHRKRTAVRTEQIGFRCSPAFLADVHTVKDQLGAMRGEKLSVADVLEEALELLKKQLGPKGDG